MKSAALAFGLLISLPVLATDFTCNGKTKDEPIAVTYIEGGLTYHNGRYIEVTVRRVTREGGVLTVTGVSKDVVFPGGGSQNTTVVVDLNNKTATLTIKNSSFYRQSEQTHKLTCTL